METVGSRSAPTTEAEGCADPAVGGAGAGDRDRAHRLVLLGVLFVAAVLRLYRLGADSLWDNEILSLRRATVGLGEAFRMLQDGTHPPGYSQGVLRPWMALGEGELMQRLPSAVFGVVAVAVTAAVATRIAGPRAGIAAAAVLAVMPLHVYYSREGRMYALLALVVIAWVAALVRAHDRDTWADWAAYAALGTAILYTHYYGGFTVVSVVSVVALWEVRAGWTARTGRWLIATAAIGVGFLPWLPSFLRQLGDDPVAHLRPVTPGQLGEIPVLFFTAFAGHSTLDSVVVGSALVVSTALALRVVWSGRGAQPSAGFAAAVVIGALFGTFALSILASAIRPLVFIRYFVGILPLVAVVVGVVVARLRPVSVVAVGALLIVGVVHTVPTVVDTWRPPFEEITDRIETSDPAEFVVVAVGGGRDYRTTGLDFYLDPAFSITNVKGSVDDPDFDAALEQVDGSVGVWVLQYGRAREFSPPGGFTASSSERFEARFLFHGTYRYALTLLDRGAS